MWVVSTCSWPSQSAITEVSTPARSSRIAALCRLCRLRHRRHWTKPLRGIDSWRVRVPPSDLSAVLMKFDCDAMKALFVALSHRKGASHDCSSTTDDRGHAGAESVAAYAGVVSSTGVIVRTLLPHIAGIADPRTHPDLSNLPHKREEVSD